MLLFESFWASEISAAKLKIRLSSSIIVINFYSSLTSKTSTKKIKIKNWGSLTHSQSRPLLLQKHGHCGGQTSQAVSIYQSWECERSCPHFPASLPLPHTCTPLCILFMCLVHCGNSELPTLSAWPTTKTYIGTQRRKWSCPCQTWIHTKLNDIILF